MGVLDDVAAAGIVTMAERKAQAKAKAKSAAKAKAKGKAKARATAPGLKRRRLRRKTACTPMPAKSKAKSAAVAVVGRGTGPAVWDPDELKLSHAFKTERGASFVQLRVSSGGAKKFSLGQLHCLNLGLLKDECIDLAGAIISKLETETLSSFSAAKDRVRELTSGSG